MLDVRAKFVWRVESSSESIRSILGDDTLVYAQRREYTSVSLKVPQESSPEGKILVPKEIREKAAQVDKLLTHSELLLDRVFYTTVTSRDASISTNVDADVMKFLTDLRMPISFEVIALPENGDSS